MSAAIGFFLSTQKEFEIPGRRGTRVIGVRAIEVLLYLFKQPRNIIGVIKYSFFNIRIYCSVPLSVTVCICRIDDEIVSVPMQWYLEVLVHFNTLIRPKNSETGHYSDMKCTCPKLKFEHSSKQTIYC